MSRRLGRLHSVLLPSDRREGWPGGPRACLAADCALLVLGVATAALVATGTASAARVLLVLASACLIPGGALLTRLPVEDPLEALGVAIALGLTIEAAGALGMVWTGWWHPLGWGVVLLSLAGVLLVLDLRRGVSALRAERAR
jgi:hypothetical protein